ncbi:MAG TPA: vitamin B12-dependent ribonucleotide reductase [Clostridiales bacterium]|nr:vitamin B12-dependent ribonucleotide reductase [Clostridiales bacterium]
MVVSENAQRVLEKRYLVKDENGNPVETVDELFHRVAHAIAQSDKRYAPDADLGETEEIFYRMMTELEFLPNSPTLMNAGRPLGQLSACFVLPVEDSMEDIFEAIKQAALIHKSGGGTGFSFSRLRPKGSTVNSTGGVASGPISFMKVFNMATEAVKQGGTRRGANMGILRVDHPDILEFIDCKANNNEINNFNISVGLTEAFMNAVEQNADYDLIEPHTKQKVGSLHARTVFERIVDAAWRNGEPGIIFLDRLNRDNIVPSQGEIESTNPCGEQPLLPYESCNLGSINLTKMLKQTDGRYEFDWDKLKQTVKNAVHFLDNVIDANRYPLEKIDEVTKQTRKIGLGIMGWADSLLLMGIPYNTEEAIALGEKVMRFISEQGRQESAELAKTRGAFPLFEQSILPKEVPQRNATITTIAPTGTLSIIAGCSSGVEPIFGYVFIRNIMDGTEMIEVNPILKAELEKRGLYSEALMKCIAKEGTIAHIEELPEDLRRVFVSAHDIHPEDHIRMQAAFQRATDNAVSKTVNFPNSATREDVAQVYRLAFQLGCKGVTIYRDGSRSEQVLNIGKVKKDGETAAQETARITPRPRPDTVIGVTERVKIGCGNLYITVNYDDQGICEVFTNTGKAGGCPSQSEATARLASVALRSGIDVKSIVDQLKGIRCPSTIRQPGLKCTSCPDAIAKTIERVYREQVELGRWPSSPEMQSRPMPVPGKTEQPEPPVQRRWHGDGSEGLHFCPECGAKLEHEGGCVMCRQCGFSKCG